MRRAILAALAALMATFGLSADAPNIYAIRGARIVTAAGPPIDSGTIVIRRGVIEAVGASAQVPGDATVIEGKGATVYPGLIDLGNSFAADQGAPATPQNLRTIAELERWKREQILKPQARAADAVKVDDAELTRLAAVGITSVLAVPSGDVIAGQSALMNVVAPPDPPQIGNIVESRRGLVVVKTSVALHVSFPDRPRAGGNVYPQSLMGVIAFVRQAFLDAQHYHGVARVLPSRARSGESGAPIQSVDPALEAMGPVIDRRMPVAFEANEAREIRRALKMARALNLDVIVTGGRQAGEVIADLQREKARVIYSLNYPQRPRTLAPDADEPIQALRTRAGAARTPGELARAGVGFAFESAGLGDPKQFLANAAKAVKAGLSEDAAIRALTIDAAAIAGVADRLGSLETGKIANVIVTDGSLFDERTKITNAFVEGRAVSLELPPAAVAGQGHDREQQPRPW